jgi:hypothetical protein
MKASHLGAINKYDQYRSEARAIAKESLPSSLKRLSLEKIDHKALAAFRTWQYLPERKVNWDWTFSSRYCIRYPKAFDLSVWNGNTLLSLTLGRPTYKGTSIRMDFIESLPKHTIYTGELFSVSLLAYQTYGRLIGAEYIRIIEPTNEKLINFYISQDSGFKLVSAKQGNPHYLVKKL